MKFLRKLLLTVVAVVKAILKTPFKFGKAIVKTPLRMMLFVGLFMLAMLIGVAYKRGAENFAIFRQEATLNPINNKQAKF